MGPEPRVATITTLQAPLKRTLSFVKYHLNLGIYHMYLFFDDPNDKAIPKLSNHNRITCVQCDEEYWFDKKIQRDAKIQMKQKINATHALTLSRNSNIDWLLHIDSDELLYTRKSIIDLFSRIPDTVDVIRFPVLEATPQKREYKNPFLDIKLFKIHLGLKSRYEDFKIDPNNRKAHLRKAKFWYRRKKLYYLLRNGKEKEVDSFLLGHNQGKAATRTSANIKFIGNHLPIPQKGEVPTINISQNGYIMHYDCLGYKEWKQKWTSRLNGSANFETERFSKERIQQMKLFETALNKNEKELESLYKELYYLSYYDRILLYLTGLVKKISHDEDLFKSLAQNFNSYNK